jgi:dienelactone hydrolase
MRRHVNVLACLLGLFLSSLSAVPSAVAQPAPPPSIADFFKREQMLDPKLSPNGQYIAVSLRGKDNSLVLAVVDLHDTKSSKVVGGFNDADVGGYSWVNDEWLIYTGVVGENTDIRNWHGTDIWAVRRDGKQSHALSTGRGAGRHQNDSGDVSIVGRPLDDSGDVIVARDRWDESGSYMGGELSRLNVDSGHVRRILTGLNNIQGWCIDPDGNPWCGISANGHFTKTYLRNSEGQLVLWQESDELEHKTVIPLFSDGKGLILAEAPTDHGEAAIFRVDPVTLKREDKPLVSTPGYDVDAQAVLDRQSRQVAGIKYQTDAVGTVWLKPAMKAAQAAIDKMLPGRNNDLQCSNCLKDPTVLVTSYSDVQPAEFYLYTAADNKLQPIGSTRPWINAEQMGHQDMFRFKARDGLEIPVLVTQPPGAANGPRPAVMMVHGGPNARGAYWGWKAETQLLASRGYVVIEPEFRGSTGYGWELFHAGWRQWGLTMQDDVTDALKWTVSKGWVDPKRVCIAGASYGGYAVLMGMIKDPDLYQCGIDWVGVTDIGLLDSITWSDASDVWKKYGMKQVVADPDKDAEQIKQTSPLRRAAELKKPLILAYGGLDRRVPFKHGTDFRDAVIAGGNKDVEWIFYPEEQHGWHKLEDNIDFWTRVDKLLARTIGTGPGTAR